MFSIDEILEQLGFRKMQPVKGRASVADLFRPSRRCGIYVLHFSNDQYYVGQAVDVVRRYAQHRYIHTDIENISFKRVASGKLNEEEKLIVRTLETNGFRLRNIQLVSFSYGVTDFDLIMSSEDQKRWLDDLNFQDLAGERVVNQQLRERYTQRFLLFQQKVFASEVTPILQQYVNSCIPAIKRTEISFWACSCLPPHRNSEITMYSRINIGGQMTLQVYETAGQIIFDWFLDRSSAHEILDLSFRGNLKRMRKAIFADELVQVGNTSLVRGAPDQVFISCQKAKAALSLLNNEKFILACRRFNLGLVQKGPCLWGKNHCLDLADKLIG